MPTRDLLEELNGYLRRTIVPELRFSQSVYEDVLFGNLPTESKWIGRSETYMIIPPIKKGDR